MHESALVDGLLEHRRQDRRVQPRAAQGGEDALMPLRVERLVRDRAERSEQSGVRLPRIPRERVRVEHASAPGNTRGVSGAAQGALQVRGDLRRIAGALRHVSDRRRRAPRRG